MRQYLLTFVFGAAMIMGGVSAYAQSNDTSDSVENSAENSATQQTDRSEEDWRKSKKKRTSKDRSDPFKNIFNTGAGINLPPMRPIDKLPEESRKHLKNQRARVIATMEFGDSPQAQEKNTKNAKYVPSEEAKNDPVLAKEEETVWDVIVTDLQGGSSTSPPQSADGPNKVAVVGRGGSGSQSVMRGGSALSAAEIMARLKGMKPGTAGGGNGQSQGQNQGSGQGLGSSAGQGQAPQGGADGNSDTDSQSAMRGGSAQNASDILSGLKNGQGTQNGTNENGTSDNGTSDNSSDGQANSQSDSQNGSGQQGQSDGQSASAGQGWQGQENGGAQNENGGDKTTSQTPEALSPLSLPQAEQAKSDVKCSASSASSYLKRAKGDESSCD